MQEKVETPNTQLQKVTLLVTMHDYDPEDLDAGEWLLNVLTVTQNNATSAPYAAKAYAQAMQVLSVENCEIVVSNGL
jgi:hydroxypyruvate isomerase